MHNIFAFVFAVALLTAIYMACTAHKVIAVLCGTVCAVCVIVPLVKDFREMSRTEPPTDGPRSA